jgi:hypothetical protein
MLVILLLGYGIAYEREKDLNAKVLNVVTILEIINQICKTY